jgi:hypothetical protein
VGMVWGVLHNRIACAKKGEPESRPYEERVSVDSKRRTVSPMHINLSNFERGAASPSPPLRGPSPERGTDPQTISKQNWPLGEG